MALPANTEFVVAASQAFTFNVTGLKPLTKHNFIFDSKNHNADCVPFGKVLGGDIITDEQGTCSFIYHYSSGLPTTNTDYTAFNSLLNNVIGNKTAQIQSADGASSAHIVISITNSTEVDVYTVGSVTTTYFG